MRRRSSLLILPACVALGLIAAVAVPSWRQSLQNQLHHPEREILATAEGDLLNNGTTCKVLKYRLGEEIYVEVLQLTDANDPPLIDRILLPDSRDGLFNFQGHVTRLAIADIDNSGSYKLLAPTFDAQLVPHLNVYRFDANSRHFVPYTPPK